MPIPNQFKDFGKNAWQEGRENCNDGNCNTEVVVTARSHISSLNFGAKRAK